MKKYKLLDLVTKGSHARRSIDSDVIVGDKYKGFGKGDILDANAVVQLIAVMMNEGIAGLPQEITSANIKDGTITEDDLSEELKNMLKTGFAENEYDEDAEALMLDSKKSSETAA